MFKIKNKSKDVRKFRDKISGKDIFVNPGKFVLTKNPPKDNPVWVIKECLEKKEEKKINKKEVNNNDSSSS